MADSTIEACEVAWDCATGNGQAGTHLARCFERGIATDESAEMLAQAPPDPRIDYRRVGEAEDTCLEDHSADLMTVAAAIHWSGRRPSGVFGMQASLACST